MRPVPCAVVIVVTLLLAFAFLTWTALEASGVAVLETRRADGGTRRTRVWFAEHDGALWLEAPVPDREWLVDVRAAPRVSLERAGGSAVYDAVPVAGGGHEAIRALLRAKYGWRDWWVGCLQDTSHSVAVRLVPR
ncbi:nitroreductase family deazaflavin-dependent oxidoreductase [bacterium]|nr:nitroreductase family deazaflavin-dependent oxidoreductase [bacterium]